MKVKNKHSFSSFISGIAGTVAVASIAVTATILRDETKRKNVKKELVKLKDQAFNLTNINNQNN